MKNLFQNILGGFLTLKPICDRNSTVWQAHVAFAALYTRFCGVLALILTLASKTSQNLTGIARLKRHFREEMCAEALIIAEAISTWATSNQRLDILETVKFTLPGLLGGRDFKSAA